MTRSSLMYVLMIFPFYYTVVTSCPQSHGIVKDLKDVSFETAHLYHVLQLLLFYCVLCIIICLIDMCLL